MATRTNTRAMSTGLNGYKIGAIIAHILSWLTTYWLVSWVFDPKTQTDQAIVLIVSLAVEYLLHRMKKLLFDASKGNDGVGWAGFVFDSLINAGGAFPKMGRLASWPPLAALFGAFGIDISKDAGNTIAAFVLALIGGIVLSVLPIRLWRAGNKDRDRDRDED